MLNKLTVTFTVLFFFCAILSAIMEGGGGVNVTRLTTDLSASATTMSVNSTSGFLSQDYVTMGNERIAYTGKTSASFTGLTRGYSSTEAKAHSTNDKVYSSDASVLNTALGFKVITTGTTVGFMEIMGMLGAFFTTSLPRLIMWDFSFLKVGGIMTYVHFFLLCISVGFVVSWLVIIVQAFGGVLQRILVRV